MSLFERFDTRSFQKAESAQAANPSNLANSGQQNSGLATLATLEGSKSTLELGNRLREAIDRITQEFDPALLDRMTVLEQTRKAKLDQIDFNSVSAICAWECGWLEFIVNLKRKAQTNG